jgi:hypothetical protein
MVIKNRLQVEEGQTTQWPKEKSQLDFGTVLTVL